MGERGFELIYFSIKQLVVRLMVTKYDKIWSRFNNTPTLCQK